jgi:hypothetical protein
VWLSSLRIKDTKFKNGGYLEHAAIDFIVALFETEAAEQ